MREGKYLLNFCVCMRLYCFSIFVLAQDGKNRVCSPRTKCQEAQCPSGYWESAACYDPLGPKVCTKCSSCKPGEYVVQACSGRQDTRCAPCRSSCLDVVADPVNGMVGSCDTGTDVQDAVQCRYSSTPLLQSCAANEWFAGTLTPTLLASNASSYDTGSPQNLLHPFRSDISLDASMVVYLGSAGSNDAVRQTIVKVVHQSTGKVLSYVYPRLAFFNRLDVSGSQKNASLYPVASLLIWNATDVMFSHDASYIYLFFSFTYDFIARCKVLDPGAEAAAIMMQPSDCSHLSVATISPSVSSTTFKGCTHLRSLASSSLPYMACIYDVEEKQTVLHLVSETNGSKVVLDGAAASSVVGQPKSPPAWNAANRTIYYICNINDGSNHAVRYVTLMESSLSLQVRSSGFFYQGAGTSREYHSLVFYSSAVLLAADRSRMVTFSAYNGQPFSARLEQVVSPSSIKDVALRGTSAGANPAVYLLVHEMRSWAMYTHCAPCPANSISNAGSSPTSPGINACKCKQDYYGLIARPVVDVCRRCANYGADLTLNACPYGMYKTNVRCATDSKTDTTCAPCRTQCRAGLNGSDPGQYISRQCDGTGTLPDVLCTDCTRRCSQV